LAASAHAAETGYGLMAAVLPASPLAYDLIITARDIYVK